MSKAAKSKCTQCSNARVVPNTATTGLIQPHPDELHCSATEYGDAALFRSTVIAVLLIPNKPGSLI